MEKSGWGRWIIGFSLLLAGCGGLKVDDFLHPNSTNTSSVDPVAPTATPPTATPTPTPSPSPAGLNGVVAIAAGGHSCALLSDSTVKCWGDNGAGELGDGTTTRRTSPVSVSGLSEVTAITVGRNRHTCALLSDSSVQCWGWNIHGEVGDGTTTRRKTPVSVNGLSGVQAMTSGGSHNCALLSDSSVKCWGYNEYGQLGDGTTTDRSTPVSVSGLSGVTAIAAGSNYTCALLSNAKVKCWGKNDYQQLGDGTTTDRLTPVSVSGLNGVTTIAAGGSHTCALLSNSSVKCWGWNVSLELGDGTLTGATAISAGDSHSCALLSDSSMKCWGGNSSAQLGDGTTTPRSSALHVSGLTGGVTAIAAGTFHGCALLSDSSVKCWGFNSSGVVGDGTTTNRLTPVSVSASSN